MFPSCSFKYSAPSCHVHFFTKAIKAFKARPLNICYIYLTHFVCDPAYNVLTWLDLNFSETQFSVLSFKCYCDLEIWSQLNITGVNLTTTKLWTQSPEKNPVLLKVMATNSWTKSYLCRYELHRLAWFFMWIGTVQTSTSSDTTTLDMEMGTSQRERL